MTPEQDALLRKAERSLEAADLLASQGFFDFAASRAYYTMFYVAEALLLENALSFNKHSAVIAAFGKVLVKTGRVPREFHRHLIEAFDTRNTGDYDPLPGLTEQAASLHLERARAFLDLGASLLEPPQP
jgi:uncharacterized protein (UPF0332 family)